VTPAEERAVDGWVAVVGPVSADEMRRLNEEAAKDEQEPRQLSGDELRAWMADECERYEQAASGSGWLGSIADILAVHGLTSDAARRKKAGSAS
jgi:hypothetical protein